VSSVEIYRCAGAGCTAFTMVGETGPSVATFVDTGLTPVTSYTYKLKARLAAGESQFSSTASATTTAVPAAPTNLLANAMSTSSAALTWVDHSVAGTSLEIERCVNSGCTNFARIVTVAAAGESYTNTGLASANAYRYRVRTTDGDSPSAYSNTVTVTTPSVIGSPAAPTSLVATVVSSGQVKLTWTNPATNETGYRVERCTGTGCTNFTIVQTVNVADATSYQNNTGLAAQTTYVYRVRLFNATGNSPYSNTVTVTTSALAAPTGLAGAVISGTQINLSWTDNAVNETGYRVERCTGSGASCTPFTQIAVIGANAVAYNATGLAPLTAYTFRVRAADGGSNSAYSNTLTLTTLAP
jgi:hypothetical protein